MGALTVTRRARANAAEMTSAAGTTAPRFVNDIASSLLLGAGAVPDPEVEILELRQDRRAVIVREDHRLSGRGELRVADVLDETFCGRHHSCDPAWTSFWNLDDHRGAPPAALTNDGAGNTLELVAAMTNGKGVTTFPEPVAMIIVDLVPNLVSLPLLDAAPASCALVWHVARPNSIVNDLVCLARAMAGEVVELRPGGRPSASSK